MIDEGLARVSQLLVDVDEELARRYPGDRVGGQPSHTVYVPASEAHRSLSEQWSEQAFAIAAEHQDWIGEQHNWPRAEKILSQHPIEDLRVDFEDGYGWRPNEAEDADAVKIGGLLTQLPISIATRGVRVKGLGPQELVRTWRTLSIILDSAGGVPPGFVFTVPKFRSYHQVPAIVALCEELEKKHRIDVGTLRFELQIESPQAVIGLNGESPIVEAIHRSEGRLSALHFGTYDYGAACGIASKHQSLEHPVSDHAKSVMLAAAAQTGVWVCDGSTQVVPGTDPLQAREALKYHHRLVSRSMSRGYYQGWDMHPGHLITRWLAVVDFYLEAAPAAVTRLKKYCELASDIESDCANSAFVDEPATAQSLAGVLVRGLAAGAFEISDLGGLTLDLLKAIMSRKRVENGE